MKQGDKVVTIGGIHGTVSGIESECVILEVAHDVRLRVDACQVSLEEKSSGAPCAMETALAKCDRRIWAAAGFIIVALIIWILTNGGAHRQKRYQVDEGFADLIVAFKNDIEAGKRERQEFRDDLLRTQNKVTELRERTTGNISAVVDRVDILSNRVDAIEGQEASKKSVGPAQESAAR
jgi:hypothetical protein